MKQLNRISHTIGSYAGLLLAFSIPLSTSATTISALLVLLMWGLSGDWATKQDLLIKHPLSQMIWLFSAYALITLLYSDATSKHMIQSSKDILRMLSIPFVMYFFHSPRQARLGLWCFIAALGVTFMLALLKVYGGIPIGNKFNYTNGVYQVSAAVFKSHIKTNFFMAIGSFFLIHQIFSNSQYRWFLILLLLSFCFYVFYMSWGRTGYAVFCTLAVVAILQLLHRWHRLVAILLLGISLVLIYASSETIQFRLHQLTQDYQIYEARGPLNTSSLGSRLTYYQNSLALIQEHPWFGTGLGSFATRYQAKFSSESLTDNPHNQYLLVCVELGIVGLIGLMSLFLLMLYHTKRLRPDLSKMAQGCVVAFMIGCLVNSWLMDFTEGMFFVLTTAMLFAHLPLKENKLKSALR
ncbi:MAG: O-antigen ligase family protein [Gammaproteobacteria bacterium]